MVDEDYFGLLKDELVNINKSWGKASEWSDYHFVLLSEEIEKHSKIYLSITTLKRIFGKRKYAEQYDPQIKTKNALCKYLGYNDWLSFISAKENYNLLLKDEVHKKKLYVNEIKFNITDTVGMPPLYPKMHYEINPTSSQSYTVKLCEGVIRKLGSDHNYLSYPYQTSGYHFIQIFENENLINSTGIHVLTKGWVKGICYEKWNFTRIINDPKVDDSSLPSVLLNDIATGNWIDKWYWIQYRNFFITAANADNFSFKSRVKNNSQTGGIAFYDVIFTIVGENGKIEVFFIDKNHQYWVESFFSEIRLTGEYYDLSAFVQDLSDWCDIEVKNTNKNVVIHFNNDQIFSIQYKNPLGKIKGCMITFRGFGACEYFHLQDEDANIIIDDLI